MDLWLGQFTTGHYELPAWGLDPALVLHGNEHQSGAYWSGDFLCSDF